MFDVSIALLVVRTTAAVGEALLRQLCGGAKPLELFFVYFGRWSCSSEVNGQQPAVGADGGWDTHIMRITPHRGFSVRSQQEALLFHVMPCSHCPATTPWSPISQNVGAL